MSKIDPDLFRAEAQALAHTQAPCPQCGADLVLRHGKHGSFWGCSAYPACDYVRSRSGQGGGGGQGSGRQPVSRMWGRAGDPQGALWSLHRVQPVSRLPSC